MNLKKSNREKNPKQHEEINKIQNQNNIKVQKTKSWFFKKKNQEKKKGENKIQQEKKNYRQNRLFL